MITHKPTGIQFENRLQAKIHFGHSDYNRRCRNREFIFHNNVDKGCVDRNVSPKLREEEKTHIK